MSAGLWVFLDQFADSLSVIYCRSGFLQFVLNNRAVDCCRPMGDALRECSAVIGPSGPEMTHNPLLLSAILREIEFISVHIERSLQIKLFFTATLVLWTQSMWPSSSSESIWWRWTFTCMWSLINIAATHCKELRSMCYSLPVTQWFTESIKRLCYL